jgi:peptidyl-prolyl cis-trans isomerase B (cyclophilin B)
MEFVDMIKRGDESNNGSVTDPDKIISFKSQ